MTDELERRWDDAMEEAWAGFRARLADRLAGMGDGESLVVEMGDDEDDVELAGAAPYCQVTVDPGWLRVEAVSNTFLDPRHALDTGQEAALVELGFAQPEEDHSPNFWLDLEQREADRAAWVMVHALRHVYGVVHPVYLLAGGLEPAAHDVEPEESPAGELDGSTRFPQSPEELMGVLREVVGDLLGHEVVLDEDGDLPIRTGQAVVYLTVSPHAPRMLAHATLVTDVVDEQRALVEVNLLNRAEFGLTFVYADGNISLRRELPLTAVVPGDVQGELSRICAGVDRWVRELVARVGGRGVLEDGEAHRPLDARPVVRADEPEDERFELALKVLRELEGEERGSVDPATIARIFHGDRDLLLAATRWSVARAGQWGERRRKADEAGKSTWAKACRAQQRYYQELRGRIRQALRSVVQAPAKRERQAQLSLFAEDEAGA